jgi:hypothetical protein
MKNGLWRGVAVTAAFFMSAAYVSAMEVRVEGKNITPVKEAPTGPRAKEADYAKIEAMPNPVTAYPVVYGYQLVTWETLAAYPYDSPSMEDQRSIKIRMKKKKFALPNFIKDLNGKKVAVTGFVIPMDTDDTGQYATAIVIVRSQMTCCFGVIPKLNEWVMVTMPKGKRVKVVMDVPTTVYGTIDVGEKYDETKGWSLYRMLADKTSIQKNTLW